jgi:hypothetical protein
MRDEHDKARVKGEEKEKQNNKRKKQELNNFFPDIIFWPVLETCLREERGVLNSSP